MNPRIRLLTTLQFREPDYPPHFEQIFDLSREAFGEAQPSDKQISEATGAEKDRLINRSAEFFAKIVDEFEWSAVLLWSPAWGEDLYRAIPIVRRLVANRALVGGFVWGSTHAIDTVKDYVEYSVDLYEHPERLHEQARQMRDGALQHIRRLLEAGADIIDVASDYAFNAGPFLPPAKFAELVTPYLAPIIAAIRDGGAVAVLHSDGNLLPILDQIVAVRPHVLQSIDPMADMDIAQVKMLTYGKLALMGNVQCSYIQTGPPEKIVESARYCLKHGSPGGGYIYSCSNTIFEGVPLENYRLMLKVWNEWRGTENVQRKPG
ncbi:MAG TPA: uroporphyrinogen decarboxylase family protein [Planctomycetota bacterium]|nr:uroporphyrinogen decarboxylase family protein [Planctomycetota bacterium]